jgi:hypothetical protein
VSGRFITLNNPSTLSPYCKSSRRFRRHNSVIYLVVEITMTTVRHRSRAHTTKSTYIRSNCNRIDNYLYYTTMNPQRRKQSGAPLPARTAACRLTNHISMAEPRNQSTLLFANLSRPSPKPQSQSQSTY